MGDSWRHLVRLEEIGPVDPGQPRAVCLAGERSGPPEDSGGIWRYNDMVEILADPEDEDYEEAREWIGEEFDPARFDLAEVNRKLSRFFPRRDSANDGDSADEALEETAMNPVIREELLGVIKTQVEQGDPPVARETFERLQREGYSAEDAQQMMTRILLLETVTLLQEQKPHNPGRYAAGLRLLPKFPGDE